MASLPIESQIEILDLRHFSARQLRPLLESEKSVWRDRLRWDYESSIELLLQYLEARILPGFVALDRGRVCGYTFCVFEGHKAVIGDVYAVDRQGAADVHTARTLLVHMLEMLEHTPAVDRVEAQLLLFPADSFPRLFPGPEFKVSERLFLEADLARKTPEDTSGQAVPAHLELSRWLAQDYQTAGELVHAAYAGHMDSEINDQYRTLHGSLRFLHNIVRFPGCGVFEPEHSWMLRERRGGALVGMLLCSRVGKDVAHITQLCIAQASRKHGLGGALLERNAASLKQAGFRAVTLTVTGANTEAVKLYANGGFFVRQRFDAVVRDPSVRAATQTPFAFGRIR